MTRKLKFTIMSLVVAAAAPSYVSAQGFYDDDIYDAPKPKENKKTEKKAEKRNTASQEAVPSLSGTPFYYGGDGNIYADYEGSDNYTVTSGSSRDVDEYNRRGIFADAESVPADSLYSDFAYTKRIERFHNPDIVAASNDEELKDYYYSTADKEPATTVINVNVIDPYRYSPWGWSWAYRPYSWHLSWGIYDPWYNWGWGYDPYWSWNGWWGPSWGGPIVAGRPWRPTGIGSSGTHRPAGGSGMAGAHRPGSNLTGRPGSSTRPGGSIRPGSSSNRPGSAINNGSSGRRPGSSATRPGYNQNQRPGSSSIMNGGSSSRPGGSGMRPGGSSSRPGNGYNNNNSGRRPSGTTVRPSSGGSSRPSGGFSSGGGRHSGGGGAGRGGRR